MSLEWKYEKLGKLCSFDKEGVNPKEDIKYYHYSFPAFDNNKEPEVEVGKDIKSSKFLFNKGDILFNKLNVKFKRVWDIDFDIDENSICSTEFIPIQAKNIDRNFLYYCLISPNFTNEMKYLSTGTSNSHQRINPKDIKDYDLFLPTDEEIQKKIGYILKLLDKKISMNVEINKNLLSIADAIYKKEFQNFDTYSEDELIASDFGLIPKNWHYKTLDEISDVGIGKTPPRKETWWFSEQEGVKWVSIKDLGNSGTYIFETSEYLTNEAIEKFNVKLIPINTVILSFKLTVGRIGITTEEMVTNEAIAHFKLSENSVITKEYLYLYLKNFNYEELGSTSSIAKAINSKIVKKIPILIPNNKINEFKDLFENLFNKIKSNQLEINKLTKLRDTLLPKLMSGEIDVSEVNCDLKIIIRKIYIKSSKLFLWRYLSENKNYIKNTKSNETLLKSRTIYKINKFLAKFNARYRYYRQ